MSAPTYHRGRFGSRSGQAIILITLNLMLLFGVAGLAVDLGMDYSMKGLAQVQADSAAAGAAQTAVTNGDSCSTLTCGTAYLCTSSSLPATIAAGCYYAEQNGAAAGNVSILAGHNTAINGVTPSLYLQVSVSQTRSNNFFFSSGLSNLTVNATSTAGVSSNQQAACIYSLASTTGTAGPSGIAASGSTIITTSSCGVFVNATGSSSSTYPAISLLGSARLTASGTGSKIYSAAGSGLTGVKLGGGASISPSPTSGTTADPLSWLPKPAITASSSCSYSTQTTHEAILSSTTATINPGIYCGGISVTGNATLTMNGGVYILNGGGLTVGNSGKIVYGSDTGTQNGVMFYFTAVPLTAAAGSSTPYTPTAAGLDVFGSGKVTLSAMTNSYWRGILFFQDSNYTYSAINTVANSGGVVGNGTYYFPNTNFTYSGATSGAINSAFVANTITITGSSTLDNDTTGKYTGLTKSSSFIIQ